MSNPSLAESVRQSHVNDLMNARREVKHFKLDDARLETARARVHDAKIALGERGPVWWSDGAPDENRKMARNSTYAHWWAEMSKK
ncbi:hypothetical protein N9W89_13330 [Hellea sp.]|nr:hypothetical protein [Hellea sp.]